MMESNAIAMPAKAAMIAGSHGYRIDGDVAVLNADLATDREVPSAEWALQLWACEEPHTGGRLAGTKVAEVGLGPSTMTPGISQHVCAEAPLQLPATGRDYAMVLVLASGGPGAFDKVHDFSNFADRQPFVAPHLDGSIGYEIDGGEVELRVDRVFNPRSADNLSGTLALELRALELRPGGSEGAGAGIPILLATAPLGRVAGQCALDPVKERVSFSAPQAGQWQMVLALVEWTHWGYAQRDVRTFDASYRGAGELRSAAETPPAVEPPAAITAREIMDPGAGAGTLEVLPSPASMAAGGEAAELPPVGLCVADGTDALLAISPAACERDRRVSIQTATVEDLSRVKGITRRLAREIVKARPFRSIEELVKVRGIGEKTVRKVRDLLTI